jgi:two-component system phosphate regulon response regulator PhoB
VIVTGRGARAAWSRRAAGTWKRMARVLVVEFEEDARATLCEALIARNHSVYYATLREAGVAMWKQRVPDVVVIDVETAENEWFEPWHTLKRDPPTSQSKLIVLTRRGLAVPVHCVDAVFEKPFRVKDFCECVEALAHVRPAADDEVIECGELKFTRRSLQGVVAGEEVDFTPLEHKLLLALYDRRPTPMSRASILHSVWKMNEDLETRTIDTHVRRLRVKLGDVAHYIVTVRATGFAFDDKASEPEIAPTRHSAGVRASRT